MLRPHIRAADSERILCSPDGSRTDSASAFVKPFAICADVVGMDPSSPARTERSALIARLLRVRSIVYVLAGIPVIVSPYGTQETRAFAFCAIVLAGVTPLIARRVEQASSVRVAAMSDLIISLASGCSSRTVQDSP